MDKKKILLIEDEPEIVRVIKYNFERYYLIHNVSKKEEALDILAQHKYDLIILDMKLPLLEEGVATFHQIRKDYSKIPILILSIAADEPAVRDLDADALMPKPFEFKNLHAKIEELLNYTTNCTN
ncbi:MAG: response regulator [bacterium]